MDLNYYQERYDIVINWNQNDAVDNLVHEFKEECVSEIVNELNTISLFISKGEKKRYALAEKFFDRAWEENYSYFHLTYNKMWEEYEKFSELLAVIGCC